MKIIILSYTLCTAFFTIRCQSIEYNFSSKKDGYFGKIKSVKSYSLEFDQIDSIKVDTFLRKTGNVDFIKIYNEKGLLVELETRNKQNDIFKKHYIYNNSNNIVTILKGRFGVDCFKKDTFEYDYENLFVLQTMSEAENIQIDAKTMSIPKKRIVFDKNQRHISTEYLDENGIALMTSRLYYDNNSRLIECETVDGVKLRNKYFQTFDSSGRKKIIQYIDSNGNYTTRSVYNWANNDTLIFEMFNPDGTIEIKYKEVAVRDKYGNTIKKYFYDLIAGTAIVFEYEFVYY